MQARGKEEEKNSCQNTRLPKSMVLLQMDQSVSNDNNVITPPTLSFHISLSNKTPGDQLKAKPQLLVNVAKLCLLFSIITIIKVGNKMKYMTNATNFEARPSNTIIMLII